MRIFTYMIILAIALIGFSFACLNADPVAINYYVGTNQLPLSLLLAIAVAIGGLLGLMVGLTMVLRVKRNNFRLQQQVRSHQRELHNLRTTSLSDA